MKTKIVVSLLIMLVHIVGYAQKSNAGIYSTAKDFQSNHISILADSTQRGGAIKIEDFLLRPFVWIKTSNGKQKISKDSVFAVRMPDKKIYRIVNNLNYLLADSTNLYIYSLEKEVQVPVKTSRDTRLEKKRITEYYFSKTKTSKLQALTVQNVRLALTQDKAFEDELNAHFPTDQALYKHNKQGQFDINLYLTSLKK